MSSPSFGPFGPFTPMMEDIRSKGRTVANTIAHPIDAIQGLMAPPPAHQQGIDQINQQLNMHRNDAANQSFVHPQPSGVLTQQAKKPRQ